MSATGERATDEVTNAGDPSVDAFLQRLPARLRPRSAEPEGSGVRRRRIETTVLVLLALLIAVAVVHDIHRQSKINYRLTADIESWRELTGNVYKKVGLAYEAVAVETDARHYTTKDVACGNISIAKAGARTQVCLVMTGPILRRRIDGKIQQRRASHGGFFVQPRTSTGYKDHRYGCFGEAIAEERCKLPTPNGAYHTPPSGFGA
ncbi:MAG TPA: hypothetical protein VGF95_08505 [Solirubrobacteraceae bacterium]|jgi:hypothetical protein